MDEARVKMTTTDDTEADCARLDGTPGAADGDSVDAEGLRRQRLTEFLRGLVRREGKVEAAGLLGVNYRTLVKAEESGELTGRMSDALERLLAAEDDAEGRSREGTERRLAARLERVERKVKSLERELRDGLGEMRDALSAGGAARARDGDEETKRPQDGTGAGTAEFADVPTVAGLSAKKPALERRPDPEIVTVDPAADDEVVYGAAWPLVEEWRRLREGHPHQGKSLSWLEIQERLLALELAMLEEHGLTLPPEKQPLRGFGRRGQTGWRRIALGDTRRALRKRKQLRWLRRILTLGLWWK